MASLSLTLGVVAASDVWFDPRQSYGLALPYRAQTEALLEGRLSIGSSAEEIALDDVYRQGRVEQVWGLGVPVLRLPFEALARAFHARFPDRFVLLGLLWAVAFRFLSVVGLDLGAAAFVLLQASFIALLHSRMTVYEEAISFACLWALASFVELLALLREPRPGRALILGLLLGAGGFFRPTFVFYGFGLALAALLLSRPRRPLLLGLLPALALTAALLWTNQLRFGAPLEFGHRLNLAPTPLNTLALKFEAPFADEPWGTASTELFAALFLRPPLNGSDFYRDRFFAGQSDTWRYRMLYFSTFDLPSLALAILGIALGFAMKESRARAAALVASVAGLGLFLFYARAPSLTSRYLVDFMPALGIATLPLYFWAAERLRPWSLLLTAAFLVAEHAQLEVPHAFAGPNTATAEYLEFVLSGSGPRASAYVADHYDAQEPPDPRGLMAQSDGWNAVTAETEAAVTLYVFRPRCLHLVFSGDPRALSAVRAKSGGGVWLAPVNTTTSADGGEVWLRAQDPGKIGDVEPVFIQISSAAQAFVEPPRLALRSLNTECASPR
ncbi:MAG: hypothetical protein U1E65_04145 [Myxococcota bacterium]